MSNSSKALMLAVISVVVLLAICSFPAFGCYSGLMLIPTAETVGANKYGLDAQLDGVYPALSEDLRILNTEFGIGERFEAGVDFDLSKDAATRLLLNAKYMLSQDAKTRPALAVGFCNTGQHVRTITYLAATHDFTTLRGHLGMIRIEDEDSWFIGADREIAPKLTLMADYTSGKSNFSSLGIGYEFTENLGISAGILFPNSSGDEQRFTLHFCFSGAYKKTEKGE
jgi:hypothetical protein